jgi:hypothetical protein
VDEQDLVGEALRLAEVVRDHHDLGARRVDRAHDPLDLARRARIEVRGRLVEEQDLGLEHPGARERETLLLAARQHARRLVGDRHEPDALERGDERGSSARPRARRRSRARTEVA